MKKKLIIGITAEPSVDLLNGQLDYFIKKGYEVYLMAPDAPRVTKFCAEENAPLLPIKIERTISPWKDLKSLFQIIGIFRKIKPDIVNLGTPKVSLVGMMAAKITGVPLRIYTCRGFRFEHEKGKMKSFLIFLEKIIASCSHKVICISNSVKDLGMKEGIFPDEKTVHIAKGSSNGINLTLFDPNAIDREKAAAAKQEYQLEGCFVFGYVGRIVDRKGIKELYHAFDKYYKENDKARLLMIGRPFWDQIADPQLIEDYNNHPGIVMAGMKPQPEVPLYLSLMDVFVLPAWWEGFGNVLIQAAAMGVPIISTKATGCMDAVSDGFNGRLINPYSEGELVNMLRYFYQHQPEIKQMGINGIEWAKNFRPEIIWEGMDEIYSTVK
ncbi:glycosyltransferase family 4 protein [Flavobacterium pallidum]|nr:glycosyltransferase family 4 protein [Flavobacterium pallidum]